MAVSATNGLVNPFYRGGANAALNNDPQVVANLYGNYTNIATSEIFTAEAVFSGDLGGPMAALGPLVGENLGVQRAAIEVDEDGLRHSVRIGDTTVFDVEDVVPFGVETGEPARVTGIFHPAGSEFNVAKATSADISLFGIEYQGKSGITSAQFSWAA